MAGTSADSPCIWKDGVKNTLSLPTGARGSANSIYVSGGYLHTAGTYNNGKDIPCYWKDYWNRYDLSLPDGAIGGSANSIYVSGGTVYTAGGYEVEDGKDAVGVACYWTGMNRTDLPSVYFGLAYSIFVVE